MYRTSVMHLRGSKYPGYLFRFVWKNSYRHNGYSSIKQILCICSTNLQIKKGFKDDELHKFGQGCPNFDWSCISDAWRLTHGKVSIRNTFAHTRTHKRSVQQRASLRKVDVKCKTDYPRETEQKRKDINLHKFKGHCIRPVHKTSQSKTTNRLQASVSNKGPSWDGHTHRFCQLSLKMWRLLSTKLSSKLTGEKESGVYGRTNFPKLDSVCLCSIYIYTVHICLPYTDTKCPGAPGL